MAERQAGQLSLVAPVGTAAPAREMGTRRRADIQGLRAVAVLLVIANHARLPGFAGGYVGVDVFFVISGYVITQLLLRESTKGLGDGLADFYTRRIRRIAPAATATLVLTLVAAAVATHGRINPDLPGDVRWASLFATDFRLIRTGSNYFVPGLQPSLITQFWSLAVEEQFYLLYPLIVFLVTGLAPPRWRLRVLSAAVAAGLVASAAWSVHLSVVRPPAAYYSPFTRFWELGLGCLLATLTAWAAEREPPAWSRLRLLAVPPRRARLHRGRLAASAGAVLLIVGLVLLNARSVYPGWLAWLPCGAAALIIWGGAAPRGGSGSATLGITGLLSRRPLVYLGDLSYSLYLTHFAWLNLPDQLFPPLTGWGWRLVELAGTFATAAASYHLLENPVRRSRRLAGDRVAVALVLGICIAASWATAAVVGQLAGP